tara:strand:+ start:120 stop:314 length:195 start_codon:yes stop_codon:yes gene_type:complete
MSASKFHRVLITLDKACKTHAKFNGKGYYPPKVEIKKQSIDTMNIEIYKLMNYLKHPHYSYLHK